MTTSSDTSAFVVSFDWLKQHLGEPGLKIVDASWYLPAQNRDARAEYEIARIPGAVFFDQDAIVEPASPLPHTLPSAGQFASAAGQMGLSQTDTIIVYDGPGMFSAPRVWWMLRVFGAGNAYVVDGGFDAWKAEGLPVETGVPRSPDTSAFTPDYNEHAVVDLAAMRAVINDSSVQVADARGAGRFTGVEAEPRAGMRSGHMPGARNVPFSALSSGGKLKPVNELRNILESAGLDLDQPVVTTCGSGVTAAVITLALQSIGHRHNMLYDGSWSEWGGRDDTAIVTGEV